MNGLANRIRIARHRCSLTQEMLAEKVGVSRIAVANWEQGRALPTLENLRLVASLTKCSAGWLLEGGEPSELRMPGKNNVVLRYGMGEGMNGVWINGKQIGGVRSADVSVGVNPHQNKVTLTLLNSKLLVELDSSEVLLKADD